MSGAPLPLQGGVLQHVGGAEPLLAGLGGVAQGGVGPRVVRVAEGGVAAVVEAGVGQTEAADEGPDLAVAPVQHGVHAHHAGPVTVRGGEVAQAAGT